MNAIAKHFKREASLLWWHKLTLEQQFYKIINANHLIINNKTRHPNSLTDREIEIIYSNKQLC